MLYHIQMLSSEQIHTFLQDGILVVPRVINIDRVQQIRRQFHQYLHDKGCDIEHLDKTAQALTSLSSTGGSGGVLDVFYEDWKLSLNQDPTIFAIMSSIWENSYANSQQTHLFNHPYGSFDPTKGLIAIDRVCFRVPESVSESFHVKKGKKNQNLQRSLTPHLDCCPHDTYNIKSESIKRWKPIQAFIALTDNLEPNTGGFEAVPGFHRQFQEWAMKRPPNTGSTVAPCVGDFTPIRPVEDRDVIEQFRHIPCRAGDLVIWDYRIPHANARFNLAPTPREVIYLGFLPYVDINFQFAREQLRRMEAGETPVGQWGGDALGHACSFKFSDLGRKLMLLDNWDMN